MSELDGDLLARASQDVTKSSNEKSPMYKVLWAAAMLASGTFTTIFAKAMFVTHSVGENSCNVDDDHQNNCEFSKPWFSVLVMKFSMSLCLILYYVFKWGKENPNAPNPNWKTIKAVALPAALDLLNTVLGNLGLLYVDPSIYQMTRGSVVIFSAFLSVRWLGRTLRSFHYYSIFFVIVAVVLVGVAGIEQPGAGKGNGSSDMVAIGLLLIILAQAVTAVQFICEESLMNSPETTLDPVALVGYEGLWGLLYFAILAPMLTFTPRSSNPASILWHEDFSDTFVKLGNSTDLVWLTFGYFCTILIYNISANIVTQCLSAVVRSILEACRVMGVWIVALIFFYSGFAKSIGESWSNWSYMELFGFVVLMYGTLAYKSVVKLPWVGEDVYELAKKDEIRLAREVREGAERSGTTAYSTLPRDAAGKEESAFNAILDDAIA